MAEKRITVACPQCGTYTELERGFFRWKNTECRGCGTKITFDSAGTQVVTCENCRKSVVYDAARKNDCPVCHAKLNEQRERLAVGCPTCSLPVYYHLGDTEATCLNCGESFNPQIEDRKQESIMANDAPDVKMPGLLPENELFWKHPMEQMPLNTRVVAKSGMYAVCLQGSTPVFVVDGQSVQLSETPLRNDAYAYNGAANNMVNADIYFVRGAFSAKFRWGGASPMTDRYNETTTFAYSGYAEIDRITDPAAFLRFINFDPEVRVNDFRMQRMKDFNAEEPGRCAVTLRDRIRSVCQGALANVRDRLGLTGEQMLDHKDEIFAEIQREANYALAEWGIAVRNVSGEFNKAGTVIRQDRLEKRLAGALSWKLPRPVMVHLREAAHATASLNIDGSLYVTVHDVDKLNRCKEAPGWRDESRSDSFARDEVTRYVGDALLGRFSADIQQLIDDLCPPLYMLQSHTGYLAAQALRVLNQEGGYFHSRGMSVGDLSITISVGQKSAAYESREKLITFEDELMIRERMENLTRGYESRKDDADTDDAIHRGQNAMRRGTAETDQAIHNMANQARLEEARAGFAQQKQMRDLRNAAEVDTLRRSIDYDAWRSQERLQEEREEAEYARRRRAQMHQQESETARATHERDLFAIAQQIEQSKLDWREKLDAYARLQRGVAFRDEIEQRDVTAESEARAVRLAMQLRAEDRQTMDNLRYEEALRDEEIAKIRFAREMEKRRQDMADETARLQAEFERERALAAEQEQRMKSREEVETLKLMLEYLTKSGAQQVTAEHLRNARADAERTWQREHEQAERRAAEARRQEQASAEKEMAERAMQMTQQLLQMQKELESKRIDASVQGAQAQKPVDVNILLQTLGTLCQNITAPAAKPAEEKNPLAGLDQWLDGMIAKMSAMAPAAAPAAPAGGYGTPYGGYTPAPAPAYGSSFGSQMGGGRICGRCGKEFSATAYMCPHCHWHP